ncbi:hypothetical protein A6U86_26640 [Rhizobium sp. AC27/96]|uniref:FecR family protein n=1 Tax=Rhizobium TaxID=379 RepID=UPI000827DE63|nr:MULTISPECIES: FecR domain-containing protein [Rhizobium]OCJ09428.1 hypothetical protein A6U86_26640 [Rhizobium sp. AC27/96]
MTSDEPTEEQRDQAALWLAKRTGGSFGASEARKLDDWLNADRRHRRAFDELRVLYAQLEMPARRIAAKTSFRRTIALRLRPRLSWLIPPAAAVATIVCVCWFNPSLVENWQADIVTHQELISSVVLPDGSIARLGADTAIGLDFENGQRRVRLLRGEAYFEVRHGVPGTFTVVARGDEVRDIGTKFNVDIGIDETDVVVSEGAVAVIGSNDTEPVILREGDQTTLAGGRVGKIASTDTNLALSWMSGRLVVQGARVADVVRALERHSPRPIMVRGRLADRRISGTFPLTDVNASLETIAQAVDGTVTRVPPLLTILY